MLSLTKPKKCSQPLVMVFWKNRADSEIFQQRGGAVKALTPKARPFCDRQFGELRCFFQPIMSLNISFLLYNTERHLAQFRPSSLI